jgi:hypothetical protein
MLVGTGTTRELEQPSAKAIVLSDEVPRTPIIFDPKCNALWVFEACLVDAIRVFNICINDVIQEIIFTRKPLRTGDIGPAALDRAYGCRCCAWLALEPNEHVVLVGGVVLAKPVTTVTYVAAIWVRSADIFGFRQGH